MVSYTKKMLTLEVLSLFPESFKSFLESSIVARAIQKGAISVNLDDIRAYSQDKHRKTDDYPYGGFAGMVASPQPIWDAIAAKISAQPAPVIYFSPQGRKLNQDILNSYAKEERIVLLCGHYKEIDQRIRRLCISDEISLGDYVLSGGELAAMAFIDGVARLQEGVLGDMDSAKSDSFYEGALGYPCYTRPEVFMNQSVPEVLLSGDHAKVKKWAQDESERLTQTRRPDLNKK
jgi:tRNA (guanine37-N1)-methyltransferase